MNDFLLCGEMIPEYFKWITISGVPNTLFYSYIPALILIIAITIFIYKNKNSDYKHSIFYLSLFSISTTLWMLAILVQWFASPIMINIYAWSVIGLFEAFVYFFLVCFFISFITKKDISLRYKTILGLLLLPIIAFEGFNPIINYFNLDECNGYYNLFYTTYVYTFEILSTLFVIFSGIWMSKKTKIISEKKQILYITLAVFLFQTLFTLSSIMGEFFFSYDINLFGPIGSVVFVIILAFLIVRFKAFDIKLIGSQALVWALIILIGSQFFFVKTNTNRILTTITLLFSAMIGLIIIRSVKKEIAQKERIEKLATSLEISNEKLKGLDLMKSEFVSLATHQIRGPLAAIKGYISLMIEGDYGQVPQTFSEPLTTIFKSTDSLNRIVTDFLDVSRLDLGQMKYEYTDFDFRELVDEIIKEFKPNIETQGLELRSKITDQICKIKADRTKLKQVLNNLIDNSVKYTKHGWLEISIEKKDKTVLFTVKDSGVGISKETLTLLFQRFSRAKNANNSNILGTGLGLYIAKKMAEANNGKVWAESEGEGKGAQFYVELKLVE
jgi:signal transduction histidine kinase